MGRLPHQIPLTDYTRKCERFGYTVERSGSGDYKAWRIDENGHKKAFSFAAVSGRHVKRCYIRTAYEYIGVSKEAFMNA